MKKLLLPMFLFLFFFSSCKKESCPVVVPPVDLGGTSWSGPSTINGINYTMSFVLAADGTITGGFNVPTYPFTGSWNKTPNSNVVKIFFVQAGNNWKGSGTLNTESNKIESGTLNQTSGGSFTGTFTLNKL